MLKYKDRIIEHIDLAIDQLEKLTTWQQYGRLNKDEHTKLCENIKTKLEHCSNLVDLEEGR